MIENKIIIWGADNSHALGVIRQLGKSNLDVLFLVNGDLMVMPLRVSIVRK